MTHRSIMQRPGVGIGVFILSKRYPGKTVIGKRKGNSGHGLYALPGGHLEFGESWAECAKREAEEETGLLLKNLSFVTVVNGICVPKKYHYITIFMKGELDDNSKPEPENLEPDKCEGWEWWPWAQFPPPEQLFWPLKVATETGFALTGKLTVGENILKDGNEGV